MVLSIGGLSNRIKNLGLMLEEHMHIHKVDIYSTRYRSLRYAYHYCTVTVKLPNSSSTPFNLKSTLELST